MIKKAMASMDAAMTSSNAPQAKGGKVPQAKISKESHPLSKETKVSQVEPSSNRPSKKKKHSHKEGSKKKCFT